MGLVSNTIDRSALAQSALKIAMGYAGIHATTGHDSGPEIDRWLAAVGIPAGNAFCAAGASFAYLKALAMATGQEHLMEVATPDLYNVLHPLRAQLSVLAFSPSASCSAIMRDAQRRGTWVSNAGSVVDVLPGWLVTFRWDGEACEPGSLPQHIGIVVDAQDALHTVEFNTGNPAANQSDGGWVMRKTRGWDDVVGLVRTW